MNLSKEPVSLEKTDGGLMTVTLSWENVHADVDLACIVETADGDKHVVQALDKNFGSTQRAPFVSLDGDARNGGSETLSVNLARPQEIRRAIVFAFIYSGGKWGDVGACNVLVKHPTQGDFTFDFRDRRARTCSLVDLQSDGNGGLSLTRLEDYFRGYHQELDKFYRWPNINWQAGSKD